MFYCSPIPIFNGIMVLGYTSIYTNLPVFSLIYDRDTDVSKVLKFPSMYKELQKGRELNIKGFLFWFFMSLFQAAVIMIGSILLFESEKIILKISTISFTCLIIAEQLNIYTKINKLHYIMVLSFTFTIIAYVSSLIFLKSVLDFYYLNLDTIGKLLGLTLISWLPFYLIDRIRKRIIPKVHEKLNYISN